MSGECEHDEYCEHAPMKMTKGAFVIAVEGGTKAALEAYQYCVSELAMTSEDALEMALSETVESARCWAGIGTCGVGGCKH